jgi:hypothetical protein
LQDISPIEGATLLGRPLVMLFFFITDYATIRFLFLASDALLPQYDISFS